MHLSTAGFFFKKASHMSVNVLVKFIKRDGEKSNARLFEHFISLATSLINSMIQEHEC